jgi:hypothetical protein
VADLSRIKYVPNFDGHRSQATLVVSLVFALIKDFNLDFGRISDGAEGRMSGWQRRRGDKVRNSSKVSFQ